MCLTRRGAEVETVVTMPKMDREAREARASEVAQGKAQKQRQLDEAMTQERERQQAVLDRTEKLKAQRLAREEDPAQAPEAQTRRERS